MALWRSDPEGPRTWEEDPLAGPRALCWALLSAAIVEAAIAGGEVYGAHLSHAPTQTATTIEAAGSGACAPTAPVRDSAAGGVETAHSPAPDTGDNTSAKGVSRRAGVTLTDLSTPALPKGFVS